ncbi:MAG TPA: hypothetical protein VFH56_17115 [Acidimicrobiales bacterium]|nr:hypothetical protein [Acidimicrobiales bacterium]
MLNHPGGRRGRPKRGKGAAAIDAPTNESPFSPRQLNGTQLGQLAAAIDQNQRRIADATVATGRALLLARRLLEPAEFRAWLAERWDWSEASAESLMVAAQFAAAGEAVERLAPGALLALSPPAAAPAAKAALRLARRGKHVSYALALDLIEHYSPEAAP